MSKIYFDAMQENLCTKFQQDFIDEYQQILYNLLWNEGYNYDKSIIPNKLTKDHILTYKIEVLNYLHEFDNTEKYNYLSRLCDLFKMHDPVQNKESIFKEANTFQMVSSDGKFVDWLDEKLDRYILKAEILNDLFEIYKERYKDFENIVLELFSDLKRGHLLTFDPKKQSQPKRKIHFTEFNKPKLTQKQIVILFRIFKDKHIFSNQYLDNTEFARIISELTGYSPETLRQDLSTKELMMLSDKTKDYDTIIDYLTQVIKELTNEKNKIKS